MPKDLGSISRKSARGGALTRSLVRSCASLVRSERQNARELRGASRCLRLHFDRSALHHTRGGMGAKHEDVFDGRRPVGLSILELLARS